MMYWVVFWDRPSEMPLVFSRWVPFQNEWLVHEGQALDSSIPSEWNASLCSSLRGFPWEWVACAWRASSKLFNPKRWNASLCSPLRGFPWEWVALCVSKAKSGFKSRADSRQRVFWAQALTQTHAQRYHSQSEQKKNPGTALDKSWFTIKFN